VITQHVSCQVAVDDRHISGVWSDYTAHQLSGRSGRPAHLRCVKWLHSMSAVRSQWTTDRSQVCEVITQHISCLAAVGLGRWCVGGSTQSLKQCLLQIIWFSISSECDVICSEPTQYVLFSYCHWWPLLENTFSAFFQNKIQKNIVSCYVFAMFHMFSWTMLSWWLLPCLQVHSDGVAMWVMSVLVFPSSVELHTKTCQCC